MDPLKMCLGAVFISVLLLLTLATGSDVLRVITGVLAAIYGVAMLVSVPFRVAARRREMQEFRRKLGT